MRANRSAAPPQRRLVRTVASHVADHDVDRAIRGLHEIVEVAAEEGMLTAGPVLRDDVDTRRVQQQR